MSDDWEDGEDDDRGLDDSELDDDHCANFGCDDGDEMGRCMRCRRDLQPPLWPGLRARASGKIRLARTRARAKERRALMRGRREALKRAGWLRRAGVLVPCNALVVSDVRLCRFDSGRTLGATGSAVSLTLDFAGPHDTNEAGCLDRENCGHRHAVEW